MSMRIDQKQITLIQPTVGYEGELIALKFVLLKEGQIQCTKSILPILFNRTIDGIECVTDKLAAPGFSVGLNEIASRKSCLLPIPINNPHIFEFVTPPANNTKLTNTQLDEIAHLETDLILYLIMQKKRHPEIELLCVADWIDDYNRRFPHDPLIGSKDTKIMHIVVDYSINQLAMTPLQEQTWHQSADLRQLAQDIQKSLDHNVQFNFVTALRKKMGSILVNIYEENNITHTWKKKIDSLEKEIEESKKSGKPTESLITDIAKLEFGIQTAEKEKNILLQAESNAEKACDFIRAELAVHHKLAKLEGFFFLLSTRIITETTNLSLPSTTTDKNKYLFFLKTQLSDLIYSLSEKDRVLLEKMNTWSDVQKNNLLAIIAGSKDVLKTNYSQVGQKDFTIKDVIESTLGWRDNDAPFLCNLFPGACTRTLEQHPFEPTLAGLRSKQKSPLRRILLEYRGSAYKTISESKIEMEKILNHSALLCKTTHLYSSEEKPSVILNHSVTFVSNENKELLSIIDFKSQMLEALTHYEKNQDALVEKIISIINLLPSFLEVNRARHLPHGIDKLLAQADEGLIDLIKPILELFKKSVGTNDSIPSIRFG